MKTRRHLAPFPAWPLFAIAILALVSLSARAFGEYTRPDSMAGLIGADFIVVGRFSHAGGKTEFIAGHTLKGDAVAAVARMQTELKANPNLLTVAPDGGITYYGVGRRRWEPGESADAAKMALWFLLSGNASNRVKRQPLELVDGFAALLERRTPDLFFRLLQRVDLDMQRDALEELYANPSKDLVASLHRIALQSDAELGTQAANVLMQTRLLDVDKLWGKWTSLPSVWALRDVLQKRDAARMTEDLKQAIAKEKDPKRLDVLLYLIPYDYPEKLDLTLPYLEHPSDAVRTRVLTTIWDILWNLNRKAFTSPEAKTELAALGKRFIPILDERLKVETSSVCINILTEMLARVDGVPWILRVPKERIEEPIPPYSEDAELKVQVDQLTSSGGHGFTMESAGREIAEHFFEGGFTRLKAAAAAKGIFNPDLVYEGMGYVRHPKMFDHLVEHLTQISRGDGTFGPILSALGRQDNPGSLAAIKRFTQEVNYRQFDGLADLSDSGTLPYLKELEPKVQYHAQVPYLRARAMHGDPWAVHELLAALKEPPATKFLTKGYWIPQYIVDALSSVDTAEATEVLKQSVEQSWPSTIEPGDFPSSYWAYMENYAGPSRRNLPLGEIARRDPQWLAALALQKMADKSLPARSYASSIFHQLTGQLGEYRTEAFARDRIEPLKKLEAWWAEHKTESREQWLLAYFKAKGFATHQLDRKSLPVLVRALESDFFTHNLAVEQISVICQKYFTDFLHQESYQGQKRMNVRVIGWLQARGYLKPE